MTIYYYERIGAALIDRLEVNLRRWDSLVLLGPRNIGKRYIMNILHKRMQKSGLCRIGQVSFLARRPHHGVHPGSIDEAMGDWLDPEPNSVLEWAGKELKSAPGTVVLFASNVDALPDEEIRRFLGALRAWVEGRGVDDGSRLVVILTGEMDLGSVLLEPLSGLTFAHHYMIQGFDYETFSELSSRYIKLLGLCINPLSESQVNELFERTGGNTYYLRLILWSLFDRHAGRDDATDSNIDPSAMSDAEVAESLQWNAYFRYISGLIESDPECWGDLERLVEDEFVPAPSTPHLLELAGIAVRNNNILVLAGSLIACLVRSLYQPRRFADLFAKDVKWREAFRRYRSLDLAQCCRPSGVEDVADAGDIVKNLCTSFYQEAIRGPRHVMDLFRDGCRHVMGFVEVTYWRHDQFWNFVEGTSLNRSKSNSERYQTLLPTAPKPKDRRGWIEVGPTQKQCVVVVRLPTSRPDIQEVMIIGRPDLPSILSRAREQLLRQLVEDFTKALEHALRVEQVGRLLELREEYALIVNQIASSLGREVHDVRQVLEMAASGLRKLFYRRVMFSVVDPSRTRIDAVVENSDDPAQKASELTSYKLDGLQTSGHVQVVMTGKSLVVRDASSDERTHRSTAREVNARGIAIVPLIDPHNVVVGTVSIERSDGMSPTSEEVKILEQFGRQLAGVLESVDQIEILQKAIDTKSEPIAVFTRHESGVPCLRFANHRARRALGVGGWFPPGKGPTIGELGKQDGLNALALGFSPLIDKTLVSGTNQYAILKLLVRDRDLHIDELRTLATEIVPIQDWRGRLNPNSEHTPPAGVICHVRDETYLYRVLDAIRGLIEANDKYQVISKVVDVVKVLGHTKGRLYLIDEADHDVLVADQSFGIDDEAFLERFTSKAIFLSRRNQGDTWETWHCIDQRRPVIFQYDPEKPDKSRSSTQRGLEAVISQSPDCPPELSKHPKEFWIDFPLLTKDHPVGKLTLDCRPDKHPREFDFIKVVCELTEVLLDGWQRWERDVENRLKEKHEIAEFLIDHITHEVRRHLDPIRGALHRYRRLEQSPPTVETLRRVNDRLERNCNTMDEVLDMLFEWSLRQSIIPKPDDLLEVIRQSVMGADFALTSTINGDKDSRLEMDIDRVGMMFVLRELARNSRRHSGRNGDLKIKIAIRLFSVAENQWVSLTFSDNGRGISSDQTSRIFERNVSDQPVTGRFAGFGLSCVRRIVSGHGGKIRYDGEQNGGARFVIELPMQRSCQGQTLPHSEPQRTQLNLGPSRDEDEI